MHRDLDMGDAGKSKVDSVAMEQRLRARIAAVSYLPTTAAVAIKFIELGKKPDAEPAEYVDVIAADSSLSSKLLSLANSSWFGVRNRITRVATAVNLLGLGTVRTLAISYCITGLHSELQLTRDESRVFWAASLCKAVAARQYAAACGSALADEAFAAGLFQDFALPLIYAVAREPLMAVLKDGESEIKLRLREERNLVRLDHAEVGRSVAQKLELPDLFVDAVAFHHSPAVLCECVGEAGLADALYLASLFPHVLDVWNRQDAEELDRFVGSKPVGGISTQAFLESVQREFEQLYASFEHGEAPAAKLTKLLEQATCEAADNTTRLVGAMQRSINGGPPVEIGFEPVPTNESISERLDSVTGLLSRNGFAAELQRTLTRAVESGAGLALVAINVGGRKSLDELLGAPAGDEVLSRIGATVAGTLGRNEIGGRWGHDELLLNIKCRSLREATSRVRAVCSEIRELLMVRGEAAAVPSALLWVGQATPQFSIEWLAAEAMLMLKNAGPTDPLQVRMVSKSAA